MTDVQVTIDGYDAVVTADEAEAKALELLELADAARRTQLQPAKLEIDRGLLLEHHIGEVIAEFHPPQSRKWKLNKTRLWWLMICKSWRFTVMCYHCNIPRRECRAHKWAPAIAVNELQQHKDFFDRYSYDISNYYGRLLLRVKESSS